MVAASSSFVLQVCRALRNYKKATDADVIDNDGTWQRVHDDWDWGPLMDEVVSSENGRMTPTSTTTLTPTTTTTMNKQTLTPFFNLLQGAWAPTLL